MTRQVAAVLLVVVTLVIGCFVLVLSVWGAAAACIDGSAGWQCSGKGLNLIASVVPVGGLLGVVCAFWALALCRRSSSRADDLLIAGYLVVVVSWILSIALAVA